MESEQDKKVLENEDKSNNQENNEEVVSKKKFSKKKIIFACIGVFLVGVIAISLIINNINKNGTIIINHDDLDYNTIGGFNYYSKEDITIFDIDDCTVTLDCIRPLKLLDDYSLVYAIEFNVDCSAFDDYGVEIDRFVVNDKYKVKGYVDEYTNSRNYFIISDFDEVYESDPSYFEGDEYTINSVSMEVNLVDKDTNEVLATREMIINDVN